MACMWLAITHSVQESLLVCQGLGLACSIAHRSFVALWAPVAPDLVCRWAGVQGETWVQVHVFSHAEEQPGMWEGWRLVPSHRLGRCKWLVGRSPFQQTPSLGIQHLPSLCSQLRTEGPCQASTPSCPGRLCP